MSLSDNHEQRYPEDGPTSFKRVHPRKNTQGKGRLSQTVQGWHDSLSTPHQKALDKSKRRHEKKAN